MKVTLEPTTKLVELDGVKCRIWEGTTERGVPVHAYILRVAVPDGRPLEDYEQFALDLVETRAPSSAVQAIPLRMIL